MADLPALIRTERLALIDFLETLTPEEWATPSLCEAWTVQDVAAHLASACGISVGELLAVSVRSGLRPNRVNIENARRWSARGTRAILDQHRLNAEQGLRPIGTTKTMALTDAVCHADDIRYPLGRCGPIDAEAFAIVADSFVGSRWPLTIMFDTKPLRATKGLRLTADDTGWSHGAGPEVHGQAEAWIRLLGGRRVSPGDFTGPGAGTLHARL